MIGNILYALSRSKVAARVAATAPGFRRFSRQFVAGERQVDVIEVVRALNVGGFEATVSFLGEAVTSEKEVAAAVEEFTSFADNVKAQGLRSHVSIKLTELGLAFDRDLAARSLDHVLEHAAKAETFVRIDMEDSRYTEATIELFHEARHRHANVGVVIQAALLRSADDIERLAVEGAPVRLVKGAYREPESVALQEKADVDENYIRLADAYLARMTEAGWLALGTHDARMVRAAQRAAAAHSVPRERYEFQMLYGIRADLQRELRHANHRVRVYVPYGSHWYPYLMRRMAERPANLWFFLRHAFG